MATDNDPFGAQPVDLDLTKIIPRPGGHGGIPAPKAAPGGPRFENEPLHERFSGAAGVNHLLDMATPLLAIMHRLRSTVEHRDPDGLRDWLMQQIKAFRQQVNRSDEDRPFADESSFLLCTAIDEAVQNTPWGANSSWRAKNLLMEFHGQVSGGDEAFERASTMMQDPPRNLNMLELFHTCLALGFQGRYGAMDNGRDRLVAIREQVYQTIDQQRPRSPAELSPNWKGVTDRVNPIAQRLPLWVLGAVGLALLGALYWGFNVRVNDQSRPVLTNINSIAVEDTFTRRLVPPPAAEPRTVPTLRDLLRADIDADKVDVIEDGQQAIVRLRGDGLFRSGRASVQEAFLPVLRRVALALDEVGGPVLVTGHTDTIPISTTRWPSNYELSAGRAESVMTALAELLAAPGRLSAKGRGDVEAIASNKTREGRAENRRVDLVVPNQ